MKKDIKVVWLFILSLGGLCFAGYLSGVKIFTSTCAFNESCPIFLGYPACYYGFLMYLMLAISAYLLLNNRLETVKGAKRMMLVSFLGILFAGYFTLGELPILFSEGFSAYALVLPTCALGLIFYILIFILAWRLSKTNANI
ncbi:MAG: hypothetical protein WC783_02290 [Candidatus Paceibacterota bacterium]|jgi:hypothetical protein